MMTARRLMTMTFPIALVLASCGSDDDTSSPTPAADTAAGTVAGTAGGQGYPAPAVTGDSEAGDEGGGPPEANPCAEGQSGELFPVEPPSADAIPLEITAVDYEFSGFDAVTEPGAYALTLKNDGSELHEISLARINDDETRTVEELLQAGEDPSSFATQIASNFACPGASSPPTAAVMDQPGRYVAVCFIPTGALPETPPAEFETLGPPHAMNGMVAEFTIEA